MAARDTALLGEILSVQKAILSRMIESERTESLKEKEAVAEKEQTGENSKTAGFAEMQKELQNLNAISKEKLDAMKEMTKISANQVSIQKAILDKFTESSKPQREREEPARNAESVIVLKDILKFLEEDQKKREELEKKQEDIRTKSVNLGDLSANIKSIEQSMMQSAATLQRIEKKLAGGAAGGSTSPNSGFFAKAGQIGESFKTLGGGLASLVGGLLLTLLLVPVAPLLLLSFGVIAFSISSLDAIYQKLGDEEEQKNRLAVAEGLGVSTKKLIKNLIGLTLIAPLIPIMAISVAGIYLTVTAFNKIYTVLGSKETTENIKQGNSNFIEIGKIAKGMLYLSLLAPLGPLAVIGAAFTALAVVTFMKIYDSLANPKTEKQIKDGNENFKQIAGLAKSTLGFALIAPLAPLILLGVATIALSISALTKVYENLGGATTGEAVEKGNANLKGMGKAIAWFTLSVIVSGTAMVAFGIPGILALSAGVFLMGKVMGYLGSGEFGTSVEKGHQNVMGMGKAIALFTLAAVAASVAFDKFVSVSGLAMMAGTLLAFSVFFKFLGSTQFADDVKKGAENTQAMAKGLALFSLAAIVAGIAMNFVDFAGIAKLAILAFAMGAFFSFLGKRKEDVDKGTESIRGMAKGLAIFTLALAASAAVMSIIPLEGILKLTITMAAIGLTFFLIGKAQTQIDKGVDTIRGMAKGLALFTLALAASAFVMTIVPIEGILKLTISLALVAGAFALVGVMENPIKKGTGVVKNMAMGLAIFTLAVFGASFVFSFVKMPDLLKIVGSLVAFGAAFALLGAFDNTIKKGSQAAMWMALGMASLGLGVLALVFSLKKAADIASGGDLVKGGLIALSVIAVSAATFFILGMFKTEIIGGAIAAAAIGLGLAVFGLGLTVYLSGIAKVMGVGGQGVMGGTQLKGSPWETVGSMLVGLGLIAVGAMSLILYGTIFALAGQIEFGIPVFIALGALAYMAVGLGLAVFGMGLDKYLGVIQKYSGVTEKEKGLSITANSFISGLAIMGGSLGYLIGFGSIFALAGLASPLIILGAVAMATAGLALTSIGMGVKTFMENVPPGSDVGGQLNTLLGGIKDAFLNFIGAENTSGGFFGSVKALATGAVTGSTLFFAMATALMIGPVLSSIAQGVGAWANLSQIPAIKGYDKDGNPIFDEGRTVDAQTALENIKEYLPSLVDPFIDLSNRANLTSTSKGSVLSFLVGTDLAKTPFELGISAAGGIGRVLSSVAQGVGAWANLQNIPRLKGYDKDGNPIFDEGRTADVEKALDNIIRYMPGIIQPFIDLGKNPDVLSTGQGSVLSILVGNDFGRTPFQRGISAAADIGKVLSNVAQGVGAWANLENIPKLIGYDKEGNPKFSDTEKVNLDSALKNINKALSVTGEYSVVAPFIDLANNPAVGAGQGSLLSILIGNDFGRTPFQRGISAAGDIGKVLSSIAQGIGAFANLQNIPKVIGYDSKGQPIYSKSETANVERALENIKMLFGEGDSSIIDPFLRIAEKNSSIPSLLSLITGVNLGATPFERGISAAGQIGAVLSSVAQGIGSFASLQSIPKLIGYDQNGQPLYEATQANVAEAVKQFQQLFGTDGELSIIKPFITLGEYITDSKPFSIGGSVMKMLTGEYTGSSPVEKGIALGVQLGEIISKVASGIGIFANLSAIPVITGYDKQGRPLYGTPIDGTKSIGNFASAMQQLMFAFADASVKLEDYEGDPEQMTGVGNVIGSILGSVAESLSIFSNPDKIKKIKGYDKDGKPIYYENDFVRLDDVVTTIGQVITRVLGAISNETVLGQIESLNESLGENPELIGKFLGGFTDPMKKFAEIQSGLEDKNLDTLTWRINAATAGLSLSIGNNLKLIGDFNVFKTFGEAFKSFADYVSSGYQSLFKVDMEGAPFYKEAYGVNSGLIGVTTSIENLVGRLVQTFGVVNTTSQITDAANAAKTFALALEESANGLYNAFFKLFSVDSLGGGLYSEYKNSALWGIGEHLKYSVTSIVSTYTRDNTPEQIQSTLTGSALMNQTLENLLKFPDYMKLFLSANPKQFGEDSKTAFNGLFTITTMNPKDMQKRSHLKQFTDEILRLAEAADPFTKFTNSFGKMAKDMRVFAENFSLMQPDGIFAFKEWTTSLLTLSTANPTTFAANVTTANNAINAAYGSADNTGVVNTAVGAAKGPSLAEKKTAIEKQTAGKNVPPPQPQIDYVKLANAIASAIKFPTSMDVHITSIEPGTRM
jgi:hypothetical protein